MQLAELAFAVRIFDDVHYPTLVRQTKPTLDLTDAQHRNHLLKFLNNWQCRQFSKSYHVSAGNEIEAWYRKFGGQLFPRERTLLSLTAADFSAVENAYGDLVNRIASVRNNSNVTFGPVGTAKILFVVRPSALLPWDNPILNHFHFNGSAGSYREFLFMVRGWLRELRHECKGKGFELAELPKKVGRPESSLVKLVDEYLWITITRRSKVPGKRIFSRWVEWS